MQKPPHAKYYELSLQQVKISDSFWDKRLEMNAQEALLYQWEQLEKTGTIDNFRIIAQEKDAFRVGMFYSDSDAYKWLEAAIITLSNYPIEQIQSLVTDFIKLLSKSQAVNGYLYTFNQFHFPEQRWINQQLEHELYCIGHLIEAGVAHKLTTNLDSLFQVAIKVADLLVQEFLEGTPIMVDGHEEVEIALIKLYRITNDDRYLHLAEKFLDRRGKIPHFALQIIHQGNMHLKRQRVVSYQLQKYQEAHPGYELPHLPPEVFKLHNKSHLLREAIMALNGKIFQQQTPVEKLRKPEGHAVRFTYLETAQSMLYQEIDDAVLLHNLTDAWNHMVKRRMYFTGGIGALPLVEGFGFDYELPNNYAYCETCAALGSMLWEWQMALITGDSKYSDLLEWQLYNAASSGISLDGKSYLYRNPLEADPQLKRESWFHTPCCPSNISRVWASLGKFIYSYAEDELFVNQYIGSQTEIDLPLKENSTPIHMSIEMNSEFPWNGTVNLTVKLDSPATFTIKFRIPHWVDNYDLTIDEEPVEISLDEKEYSIEPCGAAFNPEESYFQPVTKEWQTENHIEINFPMELTIHRSPPQVKANRGKIAFSRGPLVYCAESIDNTWASVHKMIINESKPIEEKFDERILGGVMTLQGKLSSKGQFIAIPYFMWANRGPSHMAVWISSKTDLRTQS